jgi:hypothetical protein
VLGSAAATDRELLAVLDVGPLGYRSIAAHGHADALALTLFAGGREFLVDCGTYAYHTERRWRDYFRGTAAHNTVRVDGQDQSVSGGTFMWVEHARAECLEATSDERRVLVRGRHDGYARLEDPVIHERTVELRREENRMIVTDRLFCSGYHTVELFWHFAEDVAVALQGDGVRAVSGELAVVLDVAKAGVRPALYRGSDNPIAGWISRRFAVKVAATTAVWRWTIDGEDAATTTILIRRLGSN